MNISDNGIGLIKRFEGNQLVYLFQNFFEYDESSPTCIRWKNRAAYCVRVGSPAGYPHWSGYMYVRLRGKMHAIHRIAFALCNGYLPMEIDHIDLDRANNKISNLRAASTSQNECNKGLQKNNKSGVKGVNWDKGSRMWKARITIAGKTKYVGRFHNLKEAELAVTAARKVLHGEFSRCEA